MSTQSELQHIQRIIDGLNQNSVARLAYTQEAFDNEIVDGVNMFDRNAFQNIPNSTQTEYNPTIMDRGVRSQGASIPRMAWNHYIGRLSYNLNKLVQKSSELTTFLSSAMRYNGFRYDNCAVYVEGDCCFEIKNNKITWYQRNDFVADNPVPLTPQYWDVLNVIEMSEIMALINDALLPIYQLINNLLVRLEGLENSTVNDIFENPFFISFPDLNGIELIVGVWNMPLMRLEC